MKLTVRRGAVVMIATGLLGAVPGTVAAEAAQPRAATTATTAAYDCRYGAVSVSDAAGSVVPTATRAGVALHARLRVHNTESVTLPKATYVFALGNLMRNRGPAPLVQWRVGNGHWHRMSLHWNKKTNGSLPLWNSTTLSLGTIPARGTVTTEISVTFPKKSIKAVDYDFLDVHSGVCSGTRLDWYVGNGFDYGPWHGTEGQPV
ncbi:MULTISPECIES: hypothetical protein [unclassified Streptomyces]|uniref:hypothetical protein n=1 Tax=unclassified Streptomyces TaxID=2593676 RepID=UPI00190A8081|nr:MULTISPECIES: hypothetical protein [unclassified Streptomyces]MBK3569790.1 hypothetical protein [Streptomyces sp. MBT62]MBK6017254.1 hypothetical protein [Streptomyces sp. MBT53]